MTSLIQLITALALLTQAQAATPAADDAAACERAAGAEAVAACDRLISSASEQGSALAKLYRNRCAAHIAAHNADGALTDCNEAVRLDPAAAVAAGLAPINAAKDSLVIYSAGPGEALTETAGEQSLFMSELLKEMR
jgi:hypothetical protein